MYNSVYKHKRKDKIKMSLTNLALAVFVLLTSLNEIGLTTVNPKIIGGFGIAFVVLLLLATSKLWSFNVPLTKKQ